MGGDDGYERPNVSSDYVEERGAISADYVRRGYRSQDTSHS